MYKDPTITAIAL